MATRITKADIELVLKRYIKAMELNGIYVEYRLDEGSKVNGRAFRLYREDGYAAPGTSNGYLGATGREAWHMLYSLAVMAEDIAYAKKNENGASQ